MGLLKKTKSFWHQRRASSEVPPPLPSLSEEQTPPLPTTQQKPQRHILQKPPEPRVYIPAESIRGLREKIRYRYSLDIEIWKQRDVKGFMRDNLKENMRKSDAALVEIRGILESWDRPEYFATEEYSKFLDIKKRLLTGNKMNWEKNKPWEPSMHQMVPRPPYEMNGRAPSVTNRYGSVSQGSQQVVREGPGDVPFAQPSQRQSQRVTRPPQQHQYAANPPLQQHWHTTNPRPQPYPPRAQYDVSPPRQGQHIANTPRQIQHTSGISQPNQHAGNAPQQFQDVCSERQSPYTPQPQLQYPPPQSPYVMEFTQQTIHPLPRSELGPSSPPPRQNIPLQSPYPIDFTQQDQHAISPLQRSELELDISPPPQSQYIAYTPPSHQNHKMLSHIPEPVPQQDTRWNPPTPPPPSSVSSLSLAQEPSLLPSRQRPSIRAVSSPPQIKLTAPTPPVRSRVLSGNLHIARTPSTQPGFPGY